MNSLQSKSVLVLVVEDELLVLMAALAAIGDDEAILALEDRDDIDVVFTNINMPGAMDGLGLTHAVRGRWPPVRIIVTSALHLPNAAVCRSAVGSSPSHTDIPR